VLVVGDVVVAANCGGWGSWPGSTTVSDSGVLQRLDICTTAVTRPAMIASPTRPAVRVAAGERYHGCFSEAMAADTSRPGWPVPNR